ncbi:nitrite reductase large subunit NirB [Deinococcus aquaedulcis]|uniref:nitrite reductase large subunit NirB n=1 Tax=Deinococcus aquaedulcis TaxID=2840455 RepID=UPI001C831BC9|nr:nitrite reductase large subunit NirB [Deinococcus aquaedulcis]
MSTPVSSLPHVVIVGNGMVGHRLAEQLREGAPAQALRLTVICEESRLAYDRVHLSQHFDDPAPDLALATPGAYAEQGVAVLWGRAHDLNPAARTVAVGDRTLAYDALVLATGSVPFVPPLPGKEARGCFVYRTLEDLEAIRGAAQQAHTGVVIGGGLLGLEAAGALRKLGLQTHVVEVAPWLMPAQLDAEGGATLQRRVEALGLQVHVGRATQRLTTDAAGQVTGLVFADGQTLDTELVVFSAGIRPRDELARAAGLAVGERGGIQIDDQGRTSAPGVYAAGECALHGGRTYGLVAPGYRMAAVVAANVRRDLGLQTGPPALFTGADLSTQLKLLGVEVGSFGDAQGKTPGSRTVSLSDNVRGTYSKLVLSQDGQRVLGGLLVGDTARYSDLLDLALSGQVLSASPETLLVPPTGAAPASADPLLCSCEHVRGSAVCAAVHGGARDVAALKKATGAGTGCGGCVPTLQRTLQGELHRLGEGVSVHLCEHYAYSRQDLFDLIRVRGYRTWAQVLSACGTGHGCEVCKPAVASILASLHSELVVGPAHAAVQDTNDAFLANIQKNGTYSVVPRIPGGEITPEGLVAIGTVARKFGLYCKLTGGQRIDLLGAHVGDLPAIWEELIAAGFESGHAYGKSLRTVKSCVGSAWCRYGVQDSTGLAVRLELRYRGLRSPHKLKSGVSGCVRECAEARSKDFGLIATERGWNVYVGGNGGVTPRHAQLLAEGLSEDEVVRVLDRYLMFYVRTADRLERTSAWLERMEGGLDHLRRVILDDHLGLCAELEAEMARHVAAYQDEWAAAVADPAVRARFRTFVNADARDDGVTWVTERGQPCPAPPAGAHPALPGGD